MKYICFSLLLAPCLGSFHGHHERRHAAAAVTDQAAKAGVELGAARIIHNIRGAEMLLTKDLKGNPRLLLEEERMLHKASKFALRAGEMRAKEMHSREHLNKIEASLMQNKQASSTAQHLTSGEQFASIAKKEKQLLRGGRGILQEVRVLKTDVVQALGQSDPEVTAKLERLMDKVGGAQKDILRSEAKAASHASKLAAEIRKEKVPAVGAFAQASSTVSMGTKDPVKRVHLAKEALGQLAAAKNEIAEAYGTDTATAKKVEELMGQLSGSLQGAMQGDEADINDTDEAAMYSKMQQKAHLKKMIREAEKASLAQASSRARMSKRAVQKRFRQRERHMHQIAQRTKRIAVEDHRISKEAVAASRVVDEELGGTEAGEEVSALLRTAATEAARASFGDRHLAALENKQVHGLVKMEHIMEQ
jgi:hypothetical protein